MKTPKPGLPESLRRLKGPALQKALRALTREELAQVETVLNLDTPKTGPTAYDRQKARAALRDELQAREGREIGPVPAIADLDRRRRCRESLSLFCTTYNPETFSLPWCDDHHKIIARIEEAATLGALYAFAMARGSGKTAICRMAALWSVSYALRRYVFLIGAAASKAEDTLAAIRTYIRFLPDYAADFPEISHAVRALGGIANRCPGQLCEGRSTMLEWSKDRIILPMVPPPPNWPEDWPLRGDGMAPTSGAVISASGLTGDGIRGSLVTLTTGESVRPDLVLIDDPQTPESARSPAQNATREQLISGDLLGLAGPGKTISAVMPCTVIAPGDLIDTILDRSKHPLWRGERTRLLSSMPTDLAAWDEYFATYRHCAQKEPPDFAEANELYLSRRAELDEGAAASWPARKLPGEVSAIQSAMHIYCRDPRAFAAEMQNSPLPLIISGETEELTAEMIAGNVNGLPRATVPLWATRLTAGVDVQGTLLYFVVCAWRDDFTGAVISYGAFPDQRRAFFTLRDANPTLAEATGAPGLEARIYRGLTMLADQLLGVEWTQEGQGQKRIERLAIDANWQTELVKQWCRQSPHAALLLPSHSRYFGATAAPISEWKRKPGERKGLHWMVSKHVTWDSNFWKSMLRARLATAQPGKGSLTLFGDARTDHRLFTEHMLAEHRERVESKGRVIEEWKCPPGAQNHWFDAAVMATVAASVQGCALADLPAPKKEKPATVNYRDQYDAARANDRRRAS